VHDLSQRFEWLSGGLLACEAGRRPLTCEAGSIPPTTSLVFVIFIYFKIQGARWPPAWAAGLVCREENGQP